MRDGFPCKASVNAPLALLRVVVVENSGLRVEQVTGNWGFVPAEAVMNALARVFYIRLDVTGKGAFQND